MNLLKINMIRISKTFSIGIVLLFILCSCLTLGEKFPENHVKKIIIGQTTKNDILLMFGSPWLSGNQDGDLTWTYGIYEYSLYGDRKAKDLLLQFDGSGVVTTFTFSTTEHEY